MQTTERFEKVAIDRLVPYARNARTHSKEQVLQLRASLREFGFVSPIILDGDYNIIAGHGRVAAAKAEGIGQSLLDNDWYLNHSGNLCGVYSIVSRQNLKNAAVDFSDDNWTLQA
ncbi:hypothetical protein FACS1894202_12830 [Clostridia bacterium]|nr:hypothetical protein FACS1894202_12830 [Clostridia bacterium]